MEFGYEMQEPCPTIRLLERLVVVEIGDFLADVLRGEPGFDALDYLGLGGMVVKQTQLPDETPWL